MANEIKLILDDLTERFGDAIDWTSEEILPIIQELIRSVINFNIWSSIFYIVLWLIIILSNIHLWRSLYKMAYRTGMDNILYEVSTGHDGNIRKITIDWDYNAFPMIFSIVGSILGIIGFIAIVTSSIELIKWLTMGELHAIQYIMGLMG